MSEQEKKSVEESLPVAVAPQSDRFLATSILVAALVIGGSIVFATVYRGGSGGLFAGLGGNNQQTPTGQTGGSVDAMKLGPRDEILGNASAPVTIVEYGDYQCPFCTRFFTQSQSLIKKNYIDTGKARMVFRNFPFLGQESLAAAEAAACAFDQKKLWAYHDALYQSKADDEQKGGGENDGSLNRALFISIAGKLGLDVPAFTTCVDGKKYESQMADDRTAAGAAGVNSTPTFFVNGTQILGAQPYSAFQSAIDAALKG